MSPWPRDLGSPAYGPDDAGVVVERALRTRSELGASAEKEAHHDSPSGGRHSSKASVASRLPGWRSRPGSTSPGSTYLGRARASVLASRPFRCPASARTPPAGVAGVAAAGQLCGGSAGQMQASERSSAPSTLRLLSTVRILMSLVAPRRVRRWPPRRTRDLPARVRCRRRMVWRATCRVIVMYQVFCAQIYRDVRPLDAQGVRAGSMVAPVVHGR